MGEQPTIDELLDRAVGAINRGDRITADALAGRVLAVDGANRDAEDLLASPADSGEIRRLTMLVADLVDSTALSTRVDPEIYRTVVGGYRDIVRRIVTRFEGHIGSTKGDGLLAVFGHPIAHEDDAHRAVLAGIDNRKLARLAKLAGAPDVKQAGVLMKARLGEDVDRGQPLMEVHTASAAELAYALDYASGAGDIVLVEDPTYFVYMGTLEAAGARTVGIPTDDDGIIPEALDECLKSLEAAGQLGRVKLLYVMTYFQNPRGSSHSWRRREQIYDIIERYSTAHHNIFIIEDAAYYELKFEGEDIPFLKTLDPHNERVLLTMTFSKAFAPGLRLGYGYVPAALTPHILNQKGNHDFGSGNLAQNIIYQALTTGVFDRHSGMLRERYRQKRDVMLDVLRREFPSEVHYLEPHGGLYVWVTLPDGVSSSPGSRFFDEALAREVLYVPGCYCYAQEEGRPKPDNQLRLCYGYIEPEPMVEGLRRLAAACAACLK